MATGKLYVDNFPPETHRRLRVLAAERTMTIKDLLAQLVDQEWSAATAARTPRVEPLYDVLGPGRGPGD